MSHHLESVALVDWNGRSPGGAVLGVALGLLLVYLVKRALGRRSR